MDKFKADDLFYKPLQNRFYKFIAMGIDGTLFLRFVDDWTQDALNGYRFVAECDVIFVGEDTQRNRLMIQLKHS